MSRLIHFCIIRNLQSDENTCIYIQMNRNSTKVEKNIALELFKLNSQSGMDILPTVLFYLHVGACSTCAHAWVCLV